MSDDPQKICFVIGPIGKKNSTERNRSDKLLNYIIKPVAKDSFSYDVIRADKYHKPGNITLQIIRLLLDSPLVIADLTDSNANVFYELGVRHTVKKPVILIMQDGQKLPFDLTHDRTIFADLNTIDSDSKKTHQFKKRLAKHIREIEKNPEVQNSVAIAELIDGIGKPEEVAKPNPVLPSEGETEITDAEIKEKFSKIRGLPYAAEDIDNALQNIRVNLQYNGIVTKAQLRKLTTSSEIIDTLKNLYREEFVRPPDPSALASWGSLLLVAGVSNEVVEAVRYRLRTSQEYKNLHPDMAS